MKDKKNNNIIAGQELCSAIFYQAAPVMICRGYDATDGRIKLSPEGPDELPVFLTQAQLIASEWILKTE